MPDLRFIMDFHWAISFLVGGRSSCCKDDRSANVLRGTVGDNAAIGSSWMQKPSSASSESTSAVAAAAVDSASPEPPPPPVPSTDLLPAANVRSSDSTNRLEFLRCCIMLRATSERAGTDQQRRWHARRGPRRENAM